MEESLTALGEVESCISGAVPRSGSKRKSDEDAGLAGGFGDGAEDRGDLDRVDLVKVKKQCIEEAFREQEMRQEVSSASFQMYS